MKKVTKIQKNIAIAIMIVFILFVMGLIIIGLVYKPVDTIIAIFLLSFACAIFWSTYILGQYSEQSKNSNKQ